MVVSSEAAAAWWWIYIAFCHHYESCPYCFFPGWPIFLSFLGRLGSNIKSNQIKNYYIVILFCDFFSPVCKQSAQGRKLGLFTAPSLPLHSVRPHRAILGEPAVCSIALSTPSSGCNCCKCCNGSLYSQHQPGHCKLATAKGRYDWPKVPASTWDVPTAKIRTLVKM